MALLKKLLEIGFFETPYWYEMNDALGIASLFNDKRKRKTIAIIPPRVALILYQNHATKMDFYASVKKTQFIDRLRRAEWPEADSCLYEELYSFVSKPWKHFSDAPFWVLVNQMLEVQGYTKIKPLGVTVHKNGERFSANLIPSIGLVFES